MTCGTCGTSLEGGARFCGNCGTPAPVATPAPRESAPSPAAAAQQAAAPSFATAATLIAMPAPTTPAPAAVPSPELDEVDDTSVTRPGTETGPYRLIGATLNNRYRVLDPIGEGGFGTVYRGEQIAMGRECAIKVLHSRMARDPQVVGRFRREAQAASVLRSGHTVQTYDFDQAPDGTLYLAMELLHGRSLHEEMASGPMPAARVAHILLGLGESLGEAHQNGIVHRDIKPENIFLETRGDDTDYAKVLDFGIAKIVSGDSSSGPALTAAGQTLGTVEYMSPEQLMGLPLDGRSDLYALGHLAYEMLCGHLPFRTLRTPGELITAHLRTVPPPPSQARPDLGIPPAMDRIVMRLIEKKREARYADAAAMQADLRKLLAGNTGEHSATAASATPASAKQAALARANAPTVRLPSMGNRRALYLGAGLLLLVVLLAGAYLALQ